MTYKSPITLITTQTNNYINEKTDEVILKAVVNVLPQVNKEELIKALAYDREQYSKGYKDRDSEIVRCKDCRHRDLFSCPLADNDFQKDEDFCSWGERREP